MATANDTAAPPRIFVDFCDGPLGSVALTVRQGGASMYVYLSEQQAMDVGSEICAKALASRHRVLNEAEEQELDNDGVDEAADAGYERRVDFERELGEGRR